MATVERSYVGAADRWGQCEHCPSSVIAAVSGRYVCREHIDVAVEQYVAANPARPTVVIEYLIDPPMRGDTDRRGWEVG